MINHQPRASPVGTYLNGQEAALDAVEAVDLWILSGSAAGVGIAGGAAPEFLDARLGVDRVVLPVAVAAQHEGVVAHIVAQPAAFVEDRTTPAGSGLLHSL